MAPTPIKQLMQFSAARRSSRAVEQLRIPDGQRQVFVLWRNPDPAQTRNFLRDGRSEDRKIYQQPAPRLNPSQQRRISDIYRDAGAATRASTVVLARPFATGCSSLWLLQYSA